MRMLLMVGILALLLTGCYDDHYEYVGTIRDIEGGSGNVLILTLNEGVKVPYTFANRCVDEVRIGQKVYSRSNSNFLWVEYETGKFC